MSKHSRPQDSSILGESWVIASEQLAEGPSASNNKKTNNNHQTEASDTTPRPTKSHHENLAESISTSCESISGPDLIMPSIYETPICEGSWIAPTASPQRALRRRHQASSPSPTRNSTRRSSAKVTESAPPTVAQHQTINRRPSFTLPSRGFILRILLNVLLIAGISHLLILPEIIQQHQSLCSLSALATLYPTSCIPLYLKPNHINNNRPASISTQTPLETLLNNTLRTMAPHSTTLKHTESKLRDIHQLLKKQYPGSKHELDLEFSGCLEATRTATRRFDSLHADLRSAVDSLIAARGSGSGSGRGSAAPAAATTANTSPDARLSTTQLTRREQYVDQLTSRMQTKADSLLGDFATLDDHLESIAGVVKRETNRLARRGNDDHHLQGPGSSSSSGLKGMVGTLFGGGSARSQPHTNNKDNEDNDSNDHHHDGEDHHSPQPPASSSHPHQHHNYPQLPTLFQEAATRHQPVMDVIKKLSDGLQRLQNKKGGMFHS